MERETGFEPATLALARRFNTFSVVGCFYFSLYFKLFFIYPLCSIFLCFVLIVSHFCPKISFGKWLFSILPTVMRVMFFLVLIFARREAEDNAANSFFP